MRTMLLLLFVAFAGCGSDEPQFIKSNDAVGSLTIPGNWDEMDSPNPDHDLLVGSDFKNQIVALITESKTSVSFAPTLQQYSIITRKFLVDQLNGTMSQPRQISINGMNAIQVEVRGSMDGISLFAIHVAVEGKNHFHQLIGQTLIEQETKNRAVIQGAIMTFKE